MNPPTLDPSDEKQSHIAARLRDDLILWFTSVRPDGRPHIVPVWFLWDGATFLVFSQPNQKVRNLRQRPDVMLALDNTDDGDDVILIEGVAELLPEGAAAPTQTDYAQKYADKLAEMGWLPEEMARSYNQAIRITPTKFL